MFDNDILRGIVSLNIEVIVLLAGLLRDMLVTSYNGGFTIPFVSRSTSNILISFPVELNIFLLINSFVFIIFFCAGDITFTPKPEGDRIGVGITISLLGNEYDIERLFSSVFVNCSCKLNDFI